MQTDMQIKTAPNDIFAVAVSPTNTHAKLIQRPALMPTPPYRRSQQYHPHLAAFQQASSSLLPFTLQSKSVCCWEPAFHHTRATFKKPLEFPSSTSGVNQSGEQTGISLGCKERDARTRIHVRTHTYKNTAAQGQLPEHTHSMGLLCSATNLYVCFSAYMTRVYTNPQIDFSGLLPCYSGSTDEMPHSKTS